MNHTLSVFIFSLCLYSDVTGAEQNKGFYDDRERGWFYYEDPIVEEDKKKVPLDMSSPVLSSPVLSPREILKQQGEDWENSMAEAILNPTRDNIQEYMMHTQAIQNQAQSFASAFKRTLWVSPEFDYTLESPVTTQPLVARNQNNVKNDDEILLRTAQKDGILYFFRSDCPYCQRFSPVLKRFAEHYGFSIIPITLDGQGVKEFPDPKKDIALGRKLNVQNVPAVFLVNPDTNKIAIAGYGYSDWTKLKQKMLFAASELSGRTEFNGVVKR